MQQNFCSCPSMNLHKIQRLVKYPKLTKRKCPPSKAHTPTYPNSPLAGLLQHWWKHAMKLRPIVPDRLALPSSPQRPSNSQEIKNQNSQVKTNPYNNVRSIHALKHTTRYSCDINCEGIIDHIRIECCLGW